MFDVHVSRDGNEITRRGFNREGSINDNQLVLVVDSGQRGTFVGIHWDGSNIAFSPGEKSDSCGFGAGFEAM